MRWQNMSPRDFGRSQLETTYSMRGENLHIQVWTANELSVVWYVNCRQIGEYSRVLKATNHRDAKIEAIEYVAMELEKAMADLQKMKMVAP